MLLFPVFGGPFSGGVKKHYYTPIAKRYRFFQCGRIFKRSLNSESNIMKDTELSFPSQISLRRSNNGKQRIVSIKDRIEELSASKSVVINVNGEWGPWVSWSSCSLSCGKGGNQRRQRKCDNPKPRGNGINCVGDSSQSKSCIHTDLCPNQGRCAYQKRIEFFIELNLEQSLLIFYFAQLYLVLDCHLPEGEKFNWTWPAGCSATTRQSNNIRRCDYAVFWKWMNGFDVSQFTIVTPFKPKMWSGIQFSRLVDKV